MFDLPRRTSEREAAERDYAESPEDDRLMPGSRSVQTAAAGNGSAINISTELTHKYKTRCSGASEEHSGQPKLPRETALGKYCGDSHPPRQCTAHAKTCSKFHKRNHLATVWQLIQKRSDKKPAKAINTLSYIHVTPTYQTNTYSWVPYLLEL